MDLGPWAAWALAARRSRFIASQRARSQVLGVWRSKALTCAVFVLALLCIGRGLAVSAVEGGAGHARIDDSRGAAPGMTGVGEISTLAIAPQDPTTLYASTRCAGVIRTTNGGASWTATNNGLFDPYIISTLTIAPSNPETVYAASNYILDLTVFKTTNGGANWATRNIGSSGAVFALAIDPTNPEVVYAETSEGVFKSADGGASWGAMNNGLSGAVIALAIDPTDPETVYAGTTDGVFKSTNGGASWTRKSSGIGVSNGVVAIVLDPVDPQAVYAVVRPLVVGGGAFKSTNGGASWTAMNNGLSGSISALVIDPARPTTLYAGGRNSATFKTVDGGQTWRALEDTPYGASYGASILAIDTATPPTLYALVPIPDTDAGDLFESADGGASWSSTGLVSNAICGDGVAAMEPFPTFSPSLCGEQCDDGNSINGDGCDSNCTLTGCGNGIVSAGEQCDDGNQNSCDGCSSACQIEPGFRCGDGLLNTICGEQCDDGNTVSCDGCSATCQNEPGFRCGDGIVNSTCGEQCDDGNPQSGDGCDANCTLTLCGNGIVTAGEECDDANADSTDGCTNACTICGNGIVTPPEECDDPNTNNADPCTHACSRCGNGVMDEGEECDDGNSTGGDGCAANCTLERAFTITLDASRSGIGFQLQVIAIFPQGQPPGFPLSGQLTLRVGQTRQTSEGSGAPIAVRPGDLRIDPISVGGLACLCLFASEDRALGDGIAGSGTLSCAGTLAGVDVSSTLDHDTGDVDPACEIGFLEDASSRHPGVCNGQEVVTTSGMGPPGSARLDVRMGSYQIRGTCAVETNTQLCDQNGCVPAKGPDGTPCTADDPVPATTGDGSSAGPTGARGAVARIRGVPYAQFLPPQFTLRLTTGTARADIRDADDEPGIVLGEDTDCNGRPCITEARGTVLDCSMLDQPQGDSFAHGALAAAFGALDNSPGADTVTTLVLGLGPPLPFPCVGDCDHSGALTIDELIEGVNLAVGGASIDECSSFDANGDDRVTVDELIAAVNAALEGCA